MTNEMLFFFGLGLCAGMLLSHFLWCIKIREKAITGFRLAVSGRLYTIREDTPDTKSSVNGEPK